MVARVMVLWTVTVNSQQGCYGFHFPHLKPVWCGVFPSSKSDLIYVKPKQLQKIDTRGRNFPTHWLQEPATLKLVNGVTFGARPPLKQQRRRTRKRKRKKMMVKVLTQRRQKVTFCSSCCCCRTAGCAGNHVAGTELRPLTVSRVTTPHPVVRC